MVCQHRPHHPGNTRRAGRIPLHIGMLNDDQATGAKKHGSSTQDPANHFEPIVAAVQGHLRLVIFDLRLPRHHVERDVRRVGHDNGNLANKPSQGHSRLGNGRGVMINNLHARADSSAALAAFGFQARASFTDGLRQTGEWFR